MKNILITGCSSGIGRALAFGLRGNGYKVIATARKQTDCDRLKAEGFHTIMLDVDDSESIQTAYGKVKAKFLTSQIDVLINNAGFGQPGAVHDLDRASLQAQFETNVFGLIELTNLVVNDWLEQKHPGKIINMSSILGLISMPYRGAYNASKYALEALSDCLRLELSHAGISVSLIEPGPIESAFRDNAVKQCENLMHDMEDLDKRQAYQAILSAYQSREGDTQFTLAPDAILKIALKIIEQKKPKARYLVTKPAYILSFLKRILPSGAFDYLMQRIASAESRVYQRSP